MESSIMRVWLVALVLAGCGGRTGLRLAADSAPDLWPVADVRQADGGEVDTAPVDAAIPDLPATGPWLSTAGMPGVAAHVVGLGLVTDGAGNSYVTGSYMGTPWFGSLQLGFTGAKDLFVTRVNPAGGFVWTATAGGTQNQSGVDIARDGAGNLIVAGDFEGQASFGSTTLNSVGDGDVFVAKLNSAGAFQWAVPLGGAVGEWAAAVSADIQGNSCVVGSFYGTMTAGAVTLKSNGSQDLFVVRLDPAGKVLWGLAAGGSGEDRATGVAMNAAGECWVAGQFNGSITFGQLTLVSPTPPPSSWATTPFVARLGSTGAPLWGVVSSADVTDIALDAAGQVHTVGFGVSVTKRNPAGQLLWSTALVSSPGVLSVEPRIALDAAGNAYVSGSFEGSMQAGSATLTSVGEEDVFAARIDPQGEVLWATAAGGSKRDHAGDIAPGLSGAAIVTGGFVQQAVFGTLTQVAQGYEDLFVWHTPGP